MVKFPQISPVLAKKAQIASKIHDFKETRRIAGIHTAVKKFVGDITQSAGKVILRSKSAGEIAGRSTAEWVCPKSGQPIECLAEVEGIKFGYNKEGELIYPVTRMWD